MTFRSPRLRLPSSCMKASLIGLRVLPAGRGLSPPWAVGFTWPYPLQLAIRELMNLWISSGHLSQALLCSRLVVSSCGQVGAYLSGSQWGPVAWPSSAALPGCGPWACHSIALGLVSL